MVESVQRLLALVPPPDNPEETGHPSEWPIIESRLGLTLPSGFKSIICTYGTGAWSHFLWLFNPFSNNPHLNMENQISEILEVERYMKAIAFPLYPERGGLLPWAATDNGDRLYWLTSDSPETWPIIIYESRGPEFDTYALSVEDFLYQWLAAEITVTVFPADEPFPRLFETHPVY